MNVLVLSDIHLEMQTYRPAPSGYDAVLAAGDIGLGLRGLEWLRQAFPDRPVLYVAGNHEYYGGAIPHLTDKLRAAAADGHVRFLENDTMVLDGCRFLGCTLWTDFRLHGEGDAELDAVAEASSRMSDYKRIRHSPRYRRLHPGDLRNMHLASRTWLARELATPFRGPTVVITHHAPSAQSVPAALLATPISAAYASRLEPLMASHPVALWVHGHTHHGVDYRIGHTRVFSNPLGYPGERPPAFRDDAVIELVP